MSNPGVAEETICVMGVLSLEGFSALALVHELLFASLSHCCEWESTISSCPSSFLLKGLTEQVDVAPLIVICTLCGQEGGLQCMEDVHEKEACCREAAWKSLGEEGTGFCTRQSNRSLLSFYGEVAVGQSQWYRVGVGEFTSHFSLF